MYGPTNGRGERQTRGKTICRRRAEERKAGVALDGGGRNSVDRHYKRFKLFRRYSSREEWTVWHASLHSLGVGGFRSGTAIVRPLKVDSRARGLKSNNFLERKTA